MPVHERIYRRLEARPEGTASWPPMAMASYLSRYTIRNWFAKLVYWGSLIPLVILSAIVYFTSRREDAVPFLVSNVLGERVGTVADVSPETWYRIGSNTVYWLLGMVQGWFAILIAAIAGSGQIADDLRTNAFEVYLARPIRPRDYFLGKLLVVFRPILFVTAVPSLAFLAVVNLNLEGSFVPFLPLYAVALGGCLLVSLLHGTIILGISSLGKSPRYASIIWLVLYFVTFIAQQTLVQATGNSAFDLVSYRANLQMVFASVLRLEPIATMEMDVPDLERGPWPSVLILAGLAAMSVWFVMRRLRAGRLP